MRRLFLEEALHRLVETHHHLGLKKEAREFAKILVITIILANGIKNLIKF